MPDDAIKLALDQWRESDELTGDWRKHAEDDLKFASGNQWDEATRARRERDFLPCLTIDRLEGPVSQLVGDQRQNDLEIKVICKDLEARKLIAPDGKEIDDTEFLAGLVRNIQRYSRFSWLQASAFEHAVICGLGGWYVETEYESESTFNQRLVIRRINHPLSIYHDARGWPGDMAYCFVVDDYGKLEFQQRWPGAQYTWEEGPWVSDEGVRVARWWQRVEVSDTLVQLRMPDGRMVAIHESQLKKMPPPPGSEEVRTRKVKRREVKQSIITQGEVLEETVWPGMLIPVALVTGKELWIDGRLDYQGLVRKAKDAQRMYNYQRSATAEVMGIAPKAPYLATPEQISGHEAMWAMANHGTYPYLLTNSDPRAPGWPQRNQISYPQGFAQEAIIAANDVMGVTKIHEASLGQRSNETSGVAIQMRQREGDVGNYVYTDMLMLAVEETGRILVESIPQVYDSTRPVMSRARDGEVTQVVLNQHVAGEYRNSIGRDYDVEVVSGPAFGTARQEAVQAMTALFQASPNLAAIGADIWVANQDWPGHDELAKRLKKAVPPQLLEDEEGADSQAQTAQMQAAIQQAQQVIQQLQAQLEQAMQGGQEAAGKAQELEAKVREMSIALMEAKAHLKIVQDSAQVEIKKAQALLEITREQASVQEVQHQTVATIAGLAGADEGE